MLVLSIPWIAIGGIIFRTLLIDFGRFFRFFMCRMQMLYGAAVEHETSRTMERKLRPPLTAAVLQISDCSVAETSRKKRCERAGRSGLCEGKLAWPLPWRYFNRFRGYGRGTAVHVLAGCT